MIWAWSARLDNGTVLLLGREQGMPIDERVARWVAVAPTVQTRLNREIASVDLRHHHADLMEQCRDVRDRTVLDRVDAHPPGHLAEPPRLGRRRELHAGVAAVLPEGPRVDPGGQEPHHEDLVTVDADVGRRGEPLVRHVLVEPGGDLGRHGNKGYRTLL